MKTSFPLFARILCWFFVNLLLLAAALVLMIRIQFGPMRDWLLPESCQMQIQGMCMNLMGSLSRAPKADWDGILAQTSALYKMDFALFDRFGNKIAGADLKPPEEIRQSMMFASDQPPPGGGQLQGQPPAEGDVFRPDGNPGQGPRPFDGGPPQNGMPNGAQPPGPDGRGPEGPGPGQGPPGERRRTAPEFPKTVKRTDEPPAYWLFVPLPSEPLHQAEIARGPVTLLGRTPALGITPLLFNPNPWILAAGGALLISILMWIPLARGLTNSIARMTRATESIAEGRFDIRVVDTRSDELGRLGHAINRMTGRLKDFVTGQKRFLGDAAHELCSPLARMEIALSILEDRADAESVAYVRDVREEVTHMRNLANELLSFSKTALGEGQLKIEPVSLSGVAETAMRLERIDPRALQFDIPADLHALANAELLVRAVANLLRNAKRYAGHAGPITISAQAEEDGSVLLTVSDLGPGVPEETISKLFDPFYRVDESRTANTGGVGLGLAIVRSCIEACKGSVQAFNADPHGLIVQIRLKRAV